jgi:hypothetical protein
MMDSQDKTLEQGVEEVVTNQSEQDVVENPEATEQPVVEEQPAAEERPAAEEQSMTEEQPVAEEPAEVAETEKAEEAVEVEEQPAKVYTTKQEVIDRLKEIDHSDETPQKTEVELLKTTFYKLHFAEREEQ